MNKKEYLKHWIENVISKETKINKSFENWISDEDRYSDEELDIMKKSWNKSKENLTLKEAILSYKKFQRKGRDTYSQYFKANTGPKKDLVSCDYFILDFINSLDEGTFSTSIDLYTSDITANDYIVVD